MKVHKYVSYLIYVVIFNFLQSEGIALPSETDSLPGGSFLGVCSHLTREKEYDNSFIIHQELMNITKSAKMNFIRTGFKWKDIHPSPDKWNWRITDEVVASAKERGIRILALVGGGPRWANPPLKYIKEWTTFVDSLVTRYDDYIYHWEIWNEPNVRAGKYWPQDALPGPFAEYVIEAGKIIKENQPESTVLLGGLVTGEKADPFGLWEGLFGLKVIDFVDGVAYHPYPYGGTDLLQFNGELRDLISKYSDEEKELWITEFGVPSIESNTIKRYSYDSQANQILQTALVHWIDGGEHFFIFNLRDKTDYNPRTSQKELRGKNRVKYFGLIEENMHPKPALKATEWLSQILTDFDPGKINVTKDGALITIVHKDSGKHGYFSWGASASQKLMKSAKKQGITEVESYVKQFDFSTLKKKKKDLSRNTVLFWK